jgi:deoxyadenosine/deoxycytidine kinase
MIISIEGNIGSGKSTLLQQLEKYCENSKRIVFLKEPVDEWTQIKDTDGENILEKFYRDPHKYAFAFQIMAHATRLSNLKRVIKENPDCETIICERSLESDKNVFANMLYNEGKIDEVCYQIYNLNFAENKEYAVDRVIYVETDPEICFQRIAKRARTGESDISLDYLQKCDEYHKTWITTGLPIHVPTLHFNMNEDANYDSPDDIGIHCIQQIVDVFL